MRNLNNADLIKILRIVRKTNIKERIRDANFNKEGMSEEQFGISMILEIIESVPDAEKEIFSFLADVAGVTTEEMMNDEFELLLDVVEHLNKQEKFTRFLEQALGSMGMMKSTSSTSSISDTAQ